MGALLLVLLFLIVNNWKISNDQLLTIGKITGSQLLTMEYFQRCVHYVKEKLSIVCSAKSVIMSSRKDGKRKAGGQIAQREGGEVGKPKAADRAPTV